MTAIERLKLRTGEQNEAVLEDLLDSAKSVIMGIRFPYGNWPEDVEDRYKDLQIRMAEDLYNRIGASGQVSHSENSISRTWKGEWISEQLKQEVTPMVGVIG